MFEEFRKMYLQNYKLDPCHYFSSPELSLDAMIKMTDIDLDLILDINMHQFIEKGMGVGVNHVAQMQNTANNRYMKSYDKFKSICMD